MPPGAGNDAKARFAVNGLAVHVTRAGAESERLTLSKVLLAAVAGSRDENVAAFFMAQLQLCGRAEAVRPLAKYLADKGLAAPAAAVLETIGGPEAARALLKALDAAPPAAKLSIIDALGGLRSREAVKKLIPLTASPDEGLRRAARSALANIGDPAAAGALAEVSVTASSRERGEAAGLYLLFARRLAESGKTGEALAAARAILGSYSAPGDSQVASEALGLIVSILGVKAVPDLLPAVDGPADVRGAALGMAARLGDGGPRRKNGSKRRGPRIRKSRRRSSACSAGAAMRRPCRTSARASAAATRPSGWRPFPRRPGWAARAPSPTSSGFSAPPTSGRSPRRRRPCSATTAAWSSRKRPGAST